MASDPDRQKIITPHDDWPEYRKYVLNEIEQCDKQRQELERKVDAAVARLDGRINSAADEANKKFVTQDQFWAVKNVVLGFVGLVLVSIGTALVKLAGSLGIKLP